MTSTATKPTIATLQIATDLQVKVLDYNSVELQYAKIKPLDKTELLVKATVSLLDDACISVFNIDDANIEQKLINNTTDKNSKVFYELFSNSITDKNTIESLENIVLTFIKIITGNNNLDLIKNINLSADEYKIVDEHVESFLTKHGGSKINYTIHLHLNDSNSPELNISGSYTKINIPTKPEPCSGEALVNGFNILDNKVYLIIDEKPCTFKVDDTAIFNKVALAYINQKKVIYSPLRHTSCPLD